MHRYLLFLSVLLLATVSSVFAQTGTLKGKISDTNGEPLIGANVVIKGTTTGTITDLDGNYQIPNVAYGQVTLVSTFIGYASLEQTVNVNGATVTVDFTLKEESIGLEELVVIGYGVQKKEDKTGAVAQVTASELNGGVITDPLQAIQGKSPGVMVTKNGGDPNADAKIKIRGASGLGAGTDPLYVIDGIPGADPNTIAPEDIETFNILKDAASTAIYGSQGANGVVIITTKRGKAGETSVHINATTSIDNVAKRLDLFSPDEYKAFATQMGVDLKDGGASTDWQDEIYQTGITQNYNIGLQGGTEQSSYYASVTQSDWQGVIKGSGKQRTIGKMNLTHKALDNKLTLSGNLSGAFEKNNLVEYSGNADNVIYQALRRNPTDPVRNDDGTTQYAAENYRGFNYRNPVALIEDIDKTDEKKKFMGSLKADLEIIDGLVASTSVGYINNDKEYKYFRKPGIYETPDLGAGSRWYEKSVQRNIDVTLNYIKSFNELHNINAIIGYTWQENEFSKFGINVSNAQSSSIGVENLKTFVNIAWGDAQSEGNKSTLIGMFGRLQYNFSEKYYLSASLRNDGSSKFGENHQWGQFPTVAFGWKLHREPFMENLGVFDQLKLRGSYGVSGNQAFGSYYSQSVYSPTSIVTDPITGNEVIVFSNNRNANPDLKWEETEEINVGFDFAFLNSRLNGSIEYYSKTTKDLLNEYNVPQSLYAYPKMWRNDGVMNNSGIELLLIYHAIDNSNLSWKTNLNLAHNRTEVVDLGEYWADNDSRKGYISGDGRVGGDNYVMLLEEGQPIGNFYLPVFEGVDGDGFPILKTDENDEIVREIVGNATPDYEIGWSNNLTFYKNWTLDFSFRALLGHQVYNGTKDVYSSPGQVPNFNVLRSAQDWYDAGYTGVFNKPMSYFLEDASFLRLDYLALGYNFDLNNKYIQKLKLSLSSNNLFILTKYTGLDPEVTVDGLDYGVDNYNVYPKTRTFNFSINATF
jgi:iron complex outermembrane receptor protein